VQVSTAWTFIGIASNLSWWHYSYGALLRPEWLLYTIGARFGAESKFGATSLKMHFWNPFLPPPTGYAYVDLDPCRNYSEAYNVFFSNSKMNIHTKKLSGRIV